MFETLLLIVRRDLTIALRRRSDIFTTLVFFAMWLRSRAATPPISSSD